MIERTKNLWRERGTLILGFVEMGAGLLEFVDANTLNLIGGVLGPKWGPIVSKGIQILAGLATARRSFTNRPRAQPEPPAAS